MKRPDLLSIGEPLLEFNQTRPGEPTYLQGFGGDSSNAAIAAARQGARVAYYTRLGKDEFGAMFRRLWAEEGVDASAVQEDPAAHTGIYFITHGSQGHHFSYLRAGSAASRMAPADLPLALIREARASVSFDSNLRLRLWTIEAARAAIGRAAALADYFFPSIEDARELSGREDEEANLDWAHGLGARNVLLKLGAGGVLVSDGRTRTRLAGMKVQAVDATGAGDCFCGATLARLAAGDDLVSAARYGNAAAALSTTGFGAVAPQPRPEAVRQLLG